MNERHANMVLRLERHCPTIGHLKQIQKQARLKFPYVWESRQHPDYENLTQWTQVFADGSRSAPMTLPKACSPE